MLKTLLTIGLACAFNVIAVAELSPYMKTTPVKCESRIDRLLAANWKKHGFPIPPEASDAVMVRRLYLDLAGRLPSPREARAYVESEDPQKRQLLIERLLTSEEFADYWTMHWGDILRIKSEFPINLWPNAVYGYQRRILRFIRDNEPYDRFARELLSAAGSNFRQPEANFYRATADRSPEGIARMAVLTFLGNRLEKWPTAVQREWITLFEPIHFKNTKEWKEEIVYWKGENSGGELRNTIADKMLAHPDFPRAAVNRVWYWMFGQGIVQEADDLRPDNPPVNPELFEELTAEFVKSGYDFRKLCRLIANSAAYRAAPFAGDEKAERYFASYPVRRFDAEVLDDAIRDLTGQPSRYSSVIPEPFTFLPAEARTITLADGSISSSFLILFGRPARDSGVLSERNNKATSKQRLWLFNSGELARKLSRIQRRDELKKLPFRHKIVELYWFFYSRPPTVRERQILLQEYNQLPNGPRKWRFIQDLCWILLNSKEFMYQH